MLKIFQPLLLLLYWILEGLNQLIPIDRSGRFEKAQSMPIIRSVVFQGSNSLAVRRGMYNQPLILSCCTHTQLNPDLTSDFVGPKAACFNICMNSEARNFPNESQTHRQAYCPNQWAALEDGDEFAALQFAPICPLCPHLKHFTRPIFVRQSFFMRPDLPDLLHFTDEFLLIPAVLSHSSASGSHSHSSSAPFLA